MAAGDPSPIHALWIIPVVFVIIGLSAGLAVIPIAVIMFFWDIITGIGALIFS